MRREMNKRDWRYARLMRAGISHVIRQTARAGFRVDGIRLNKHDRKILRKANPTGSYMLAGVPLVEDDDGEFAPYSKKFFLITNAPKDGAEMMKDIQGVEFPDDFEWPTPKDDD
jgi:hypothetical protein